MSMKPEHEMFCLKYLALSFNGTKAYMAVYPGSSADAAKSSASDLLTKPNVRERVALLIEQRIEETGIEVADVVRKLWATSTADPNELVEIRRDCCRFCYGDHHRYQYTAGEWEQILQNHEQATYEAERDNRRKPKIPDPQGGTGFHARMPPMPGCPECFGDGLHEIHVKDTRLLTPAARELFAGVKVTRDGIDVKMHSRDKAMELLGRHLAMFTDNLDHKNNGKSFEPMQLADFYADPKADTKPGT